MLCRIDQINAGNNHAESPTTTVLRVPVRDQQGRRGSYLMTAIIDDCIIRPFQIEDDVKINSRSYFVSKQTLFALLGVTNSLLVCKVGSGIRDYKLMALPACAGDLDSIVNLWSTVKQKVYVAAKQCS